MSAVFAPCRALVRATLPLALFPCDSDCGVAEEKDVEALSQAYKGKNVLCVGGTKGIGKAAADRIRAAGGSVFVVGRSAASPDGVSADLSTVKGCEQLEEQLVRLGIIFDFVLLTVGVWPSSKDAHTSDGLHKVFAIDLLSRHCVMSALVRHKLVSDDIRVMSVLASSQNMPGGITDKASLKLLLSNAMKPEGVTGLSEGFRLMFGTAIAADAWLQAIQRILPEKAHVMGTFPGLLVTDLMSSTFPGWLVPVLKALQTPVSDSDEACGLKHATILASPNAGRKRVSYWAAPRLEAREPHPLAADEEMAAWVYQELEALRVGK